MNLKTISGKVALIAIVFVSVLLLSAASMFYQRSIVDEMQQNLADEQYPAVMLANQLKFHTVQVQQWLTDISATRGQDGLNDGFDEAENHAAMFRDDLNELKALKSELSDQLDVMQTAFTPYYGTGKRMAQRYVEEGPPAVTR